MPEQFTMPEQFKQELLDSLIRYGDELIDEDLVRKLVDKANIPDGFKEFLVQMLAARIENPSDEYLGELRGRLEKLLPETD
jgi:hypothetical protein